MNPGFWGDSAWDFLHQVPWNYPNEILSPQDTIEVINMMHVFLKILSCSKCAEGAKDIESENKLFSIMRRIEKGDGTFRMIVTRANISQWIYDLHNKVNAKLSKPTFGTSWEDSLSVRPKWQKSMFVFFMSVIWSYPKEPDFKINLNFEYFFSILIPQVLKYTEIGKFYRRFLEKHPFSRTLGDRTRMFKWIYQMRKHASKMCGPTWSYDDTCVFMEALEARKNCDENKEKECK